MNTGRRNFSIAIGETPLHLLTAEALLVHTIREKKGWTRARMSQETGLDESLLSRYERGEVIPSDTSWDRILRAGDIDLARRDSLLAAARELVAGLSAGITRPVSSTCCDLGSDLQELVGSATRLLARQTPLETLPASEAEQLQRLLTCDVSDRSEVIRITDEFHSPPLALLCCERSLSEAARNPGAARELAELAVAAAESVVLPEMAGLRAWALAHLTNALRVASDLEEASRVFTEALTLWESAPGDPEVFDMGVCCSTSELRCAAIKGAFTRHLRCTTKRFPCPVLPAERSSRKRPPLSKWATTRAPWPPLTKRIAG